MRCVRWNSKNKDFCRYTGKNDDGTHSLIRPEDGKRPEAVAVIAEQVRVGVLRWFARSGLIEPDDVCEMLA